MGIFFCLEYLVSSSRACCCITNMIFVFSLNYWESHSAFFVTRYQLNRFLFRNPEISGIQTGYPDSYHQINSVNIHHPCKLEYFLSVLLIVRGPLIFCAVIGHYLKKLWNISWYRILIFFMMMPSATDVKE